MRLQVRIETFIVLGMNKLKLGELFAGYGGLGMAVEQVFNAELTWYAEFDDAPSKIMAHHWPGIPNHRDVTTVDWSQVEPVDIISGGSPCQDLSAAGRRAGMTAGTRSNLWVSMREAIATIKPKYVVWENVRGAFSAGASSEVEHCPGCMGGTSGPGEPLLRAFGRVLGDLSDLGYDAEWRSLLASDIGAPHGRFRVFILATRREQESTNADNPRLERQPDPQRTAPAKRHRYLGTGANGTTANTNDERSNGSRPEREENRWREPANSGNTSAKSESRLRGTDWGVYAPAIARWENLRGTAPNPTELTPKGKHRLAATFTEWMMGLEPGHVTKVPGITRNQQIKAIGNGVQPQQAIAALSDMLK